MIRGNSFGARRVLTLSGKMLLVLMLLGVAVAPLYAQNRPGTPAGLVVFDNVGGTPVADGELFLAVGPNQVTEANIEYRLFYALSAEEPYGQQVVDEYEFGTTPGDGGGENAFGFVLGGLEAGRSYTFWLYQRDTTTDLYSNPAIVRAVTIGTGSEPTRPAEPAGLISSTTVGANPVSDGELFLAVGPNDVTNANIEYRLFYAPTTELPRGPRDGSEYQFGSTPGDGGANAAFGFVLTGLDAGGEYTFWLYQRNTATGLYSNPAIIVATAAGQSTDPDDPYAITNPPTRDDLQPFPLAFNIDDVDVDWTDYTFFSFDGAALRRVANPDKSAGNDSDYVLEYTKNAGGQAWAGFFYHLEEPVNSTSEAVFRLNVWSPRAGIRALMKLETRDDQNSTGDQFVDITLAEQWNTLEWDLSGISQSVEWDRVVVIMDLDVSAPPLGGERDTWYLDDFELAGFVGAGDPGDPTLVRIPLPVDFEDRSIDWNNVFLGFEGGHVDVIQNPDQSGLNDSEWVGRMVKGSGPFWAGAFFDVDQSFAIDQDDSHFSMKVWSPRAGVPILMKVEDTGSAANFEIVSNTTTSGAWEIVTWDMSGAGFTQQWDRIVMIFDFRESGVGDGGEMFTWYFDDLEVNVSGTPTSSDDDQYGIPTAYVLHQNYPNPFNPTTQIHFDLPQSTEVMLEVFNVWGQRVAVLAAGAYQAGTHSVAFDATDLPSGAYVYRLRAGTVSRTQVMTLVK